MQSGPQGRTEPPDWLARGIYIPFERTALVAARLRWRPEGDADVILAPQPGSGAGQYVVPLRRVPDTMRLDPYDKSLLGLVSDMRPLDPIAMERVALRARRDAGREATDEVDLRYADILARLLQRLARDLPGSDTVFAARTGGAEADRIFSPTGLAALDAVQRYDDLARAAAFVDRIRLTALDAFVARLGAWAAASQWSELDRLRAVLARARGVAGAARRHLDALDLLETDPVAAMQAERPSRALRSARVAAWLLDGWDHPVGAIEALPEDAAPDAFEATLRNVMRLAPLLPLEPERLADDRRPAAPEAAPAPSAPRVVRTSTVRVGVDWLTGMPLQQAQEQRDLARQTQQRA